MHLSVSILKTTGSQLGAEPQGTSLDSVLVITPGERAVEVLASVTGGETLLNVL